MPTDYRYEIMMDFQTETLPEMGTFAREYVIINR